MLMSVVQIHLSPPNFLKPLIHKGQRLFYWRFSVGCCTKVLHRAKTFPTSSPYWTIFYYRHRAPDIRGTVLVKTLATSPRAPPLCWPVLMQTEPVWRISGPINMKSNMEERQQSADNFASKMRREIDGMTANKPSQRPIIKKTQPQRTQDSRRKNWVTDAIAASNW